MENAKIETLAKQYGAAADATALPLTSDEEAELAELERQYEQIDAVEQQIPFIKGRILNAIRKGKLYRSTHKTFGEYASDRFGFERAYAQNLAQIGGFMDVAEECLGVGSDFQISVNVANALLRATNKITKMLGMGNVEFPEIKPIIANLLAVITDDAPLDKNGNRQLTPRYVSSFNDVLSKYIADDVLKVGDRQKRIELAAEQILAKWESIRLDAKESFDRNDEDEDRGEKSITTRWRSAEVMAKEYLESLEDVIEVKDVSESNLGYDLEVVYQNNRRIYVEVKKVSSFNEPFKLTNNEFGYASKYGEDYRIALVTDNPFDISFISDPIAVLECQRVLEKVSWKFGGYRDNLRKHL